jgi:hypothetical protein
MTALLRRNFLSLLTTVTGREARRVRWHGSHSLVEAGAGGPLFLLRAGTLDREQRLSTAVRGVDLQALAARGVAAVVFLCAPFGGPLVVPVAALLKHLDPTRARTVLHVCVSAGGAITLVETGHDLRAYRGEAALRRLIAAPAGRGTPALSHARWQTVLAVVAAGHAWRLHVPAADRSRLDRALAAGHDTRGWATLPAPVAHLPWLRFADVVCSRPDADWPAWVCEVEEGGNLWAALSRHAHTLAALKAAGASSLPRFIVVAAGKRRAEFARKLRSPLFVEIGLDRCCTFWSYDVVWTAYQWLRRQRRRHRRLSRVGYRVGYRVAPVPAPSTP